MLTITPTHASRVRICIFNKLVRRFVCTLEFEDPCYWRLRHSADSIHFTRTTFPQGREALKILMLLLESD